MVVISDPHIKVDPDWSLYREARDGGHFVKDREGQIYRGSCWPGNVWFTTNTVQFKHFYFLISKLWWASVNIRINFASKSLWLFSAVFSLKFKAAYILCFHPKLKFVLTSLTGESSYLDFSSPATRAWYSRCFSLDKYKVKINNVHVPPSTFSR